MISSGQCRIPTPSAFGLHVFTGFGSSAYASAQASHSSGHASEIYHHHHGGHHYAAPAYSAPAPTYTAPSGGASYPYPPSSVSEYEFGGSYGNKVTRAASSPSTQSQGNSQNASKFSN